MERVVEINRIEDLDQYHLVWRALLAKTKFATYFQTLPWLQVYWKHFGAGQRLRVLIVMRSGEPIGIIPLAVLRETTRIGTVRTLTYPLHDWASFYGPITAEPASTLSAGMRYLAEGPRDWDLLDLRWLREESDLNHTPRAMQAAGFTPRAGEWHPTALVDTTRSWDDYLGAKTTEFRNDVRRRARRVAEVGDVLFDRYRPIGAADGDGEPRFDVYEQCVELARRSWQGSSANGTTLSSPSVADFFRDSLAVAAREGGLDLCVVRRHDRLLAFCFGHYHAGRVFGMRIGYDQEYRKLGMGSYLYARMIEDSIARGDREFDMGPGSMEYKRYWLTQVEPALRFTHYALLSPRGQLLRWKHSWSGPSGTAQKTLAATN